MELLGGFGVGDHQNFLVYRTPGLMLKTPPGIFKP
jgi:hypothetical protein